MATFTTAIPEEIKGNHQHTVRFHWRGTVPEVLGRGDLHRAREQFGYTVHRWDDTDATGTPVTLTRMDKDGRNQWLYATYRYTRVTCKVCREHKLTGQHLATYYVLLVGRGMNTSEPFPVCDNHLDTMRKSIAGGELTIHLSERMDPGPN